MGTFILIVIAALVASFIKPFVAKAIAIGLTILNRELKASVPNKLNIKQPKKRSNKPPMPRHQDVKH